MICLNLVAAGTASAACKAPEYRRIVDHINAQTGEGIVHVSIAPSDFTLDGVICLTQSLKSQHPQWTSVIVLLFSSDDAALYFKPDKLTGTPENWRYQRELRALYSIDTARGRDYISILPFGMEGAGQYDTRIDLPTAGPVRCRLEMARRCVLALGSIEYSTLQEIELLSQTVTLTGHVSRDGSITTPTVTSNDGSDRNGGGAWARAAVEHLKTWWLEPAPREDDIRVTYSFETNSSIPPGQVVVRFDLPNQVTVRVHRAK